MTVVLEAQAVTLAPVVGQTDERAEAATALEEIIAAHRAALRELAPHQAARWVRRETAWHITHLGLLLRVRHDQILTQNAPAGVVPHPRGRGENTGPDRCTR